MTSESAGSTDDFIPFLRDRRVRHFPVILLGIGLMCLFLAGVLFASSRSDSTEIVFQTQEGATDSARLLYVDVAGAVVRPGVYPFTEGNRIEDALSAASGLSQDADSEWMSKNLNRAAKLADGGKIYIPSRSENGTRIVAGAQTQSISSIQTGVNINLASQGELEALPGIGPATAGKIIVGRPYQTIEELKNRKILGAALYEKLKDLLTL